MNKALITFTCFSIFSFCGCNKKLDNSPSAFVEINDYGRGNSSIIIYKNRTAPWRLRFEIDDKVGGENKKQIKVYFRNDDEKQVLIYIDDKIGDVTIMPHEKIIIFSGTLEELKLCGRTETEELTIRTSRDRDVTATLLVESTGLSSGTKLIVRTWALQYGL